MLYCVLGGEALVPPSKLGAEPSEGDEKPVRAPGPVAGVVDEEGRAADIVRLPAEFRCFDTLVQEAVPNGFYVRKDLQGSHVEIRGIS